MLILSQAYLSYAQFENSEAIATDFSGADVTAVTWTDLSFQGAMLTFLHWPISRINHSAQCLRGHLPR